MKKRPHQALRLFVLMTSLLLLPLARADNTVDDVKTAFIFNFARFVEWPRTAFETDTSPLQICLWGDTILEERMQRLNDHDAQNRRIRIKNIGRSNDWQGCHILFIGEGSEAQRLQLLKALIALPVLTISDSPRFIEQGGMIGIFVEEKRVQFSVNRNATQQSNLRLSARMLQLAYNLRQVSP